MATLRDLFALPQSDTNTADNEDYGDVQDVNPLAFYQNTSSADNFGSPEDPEDPEVAEALAASKAEEEEERRRQLTYAQERELGMTTKGDNLAYQNRLASEGTSMPTIGYGDLPDIAELDKAYRDRISQEKIDAAKGRGVGGKPIHSIGTVRATADALAGGVEGLSNFPNALANDIDWADNPVGDIYSGAMHLGVDAFMAISDALNITTDESRLRWNAERLKQSVSNEVKAKWADPREKEYRSFYIDQTLTRKKVEYLSLSNEEKGEIKPPKADDEDVIEGALNLAIADSGYAILNKMLKDQASYSRALQSIVDEQKVLGKYARHDLRNDAEIAIAANAELLRPASTVVNAARMGAANLGYGITDTLSDGLNAVGLGAIHTADPYASKNRSASNFANLNRVAVFDKAADWMSKYKEADLTFSPYHALQKYAAVDPHIKRNYNVKSNVQQAAEARYFEKQNELDAKYGRDSRGSLWKNKGRLFSELGFTLGDALRNPSVIVEGTSTSAAALLPDALIVGKLGKALKGRKLNAKTLKQGLNSDVEAMSLQANKILAQQYGDKLARRAIAAQAMGEAHQATYDAIALLEKETGQPVPEEQRKRIQRLMYSAKIFDYFADSIALSTAGLGASGLRKMSGMGPAPSIADRSGFGVFVDRTHSLAAGSLAGGLANMYAVDFETRAQKGGATISGLDRHEKHLAFGQGAVIGMSSIPGIAKDMYVHRRDRLAKEGLPDRISELVDGTIAEAFDKPLEMYRKFVRDTATDSGADIHTLYETYDRLMDGEYEYDTSHLSEEEAAEGNYNPVHRVMSSLIEHEEKEAFYEDDSISVAERSTEAVMDLRDVRADLRNAINAINHRIETESETLSDEQIQDLQTAQDHASALLKGVGVTYASALKSIKEAMKLEEDRDKLYEKYAESAETLLSFFDPLAYTDEELATIEAALGVSPSRTSRMLLESVKEAREAANTDENGPMEQTTKALLRSKIKKSFGQVSNEAMYGNPDKPGHYGIRDYNAMVQGAIATGDKVSLQMVKERIAGWINSQSDKYAPETVAQNAIENSLKMDIYNRAEKALAELDGREADTRTLDTVLSPDGLAPTKVAKTSTKSKQGLTNIATGNNQGNKEGEVAEAQTTQETTPTHKEDNSSKPEENTGAPVIQQRPTDEQVKKRQEIKKKMAPTKMPEESSETPTTKETSQSQKTESKTTVKEETPQESPTPKEQTPTSKEDTSHNYGTKEQIKTSLDGYNEHSNKDSTPEQRREKLVDLFRGAKHLQDAITKSGLDEKTKKKLLERVANMLQAITRLAEAEKEIAKHGYANKELNKAIGTQKGRITRALNNLPDKNSLPPDPKAAQATPAPASKDGAVEQQQQDPTNMEDISTIPDYVTEVVPVQEEVDGIAEYYAENPSEIVSEEPTSQEIEQVTEFTHGEENGATVETDTPSEGSKQLSIEIKEDPIVNEKDKTDYDTYLDEQGMNDPNKTDMEKTVEVLETLHNEEDTESRGMFYKFFRRVFSRGNDSILVTSLGVINDFVKATFFAPKDTPLIHVKGVVSLIMNGEGVFSNAEVLRNQDAFVKASLYHLEQMQTEPFTANQKAQYTENLKILHGAVQYLMGKTPEEGFLMVPGEGESGTAIQNKNSPLYEINENNGKGWSITKTPLGLLLAHKEGEKNYMPENLRFVIALAALDWVNSTGGTIELHQAASLNSTFKGMFGVEGLGEKIVDIKAYEKFQRMGLPAYMMERNLGGVALNMLNLKLDPEKVPAGTREALQAELGAVMRSALAAAGLTEETTVPISSLARGAFKAAFDPETGESLLNESDTAKLQAVTKDVRTITMVRMRGKYTNKVSKGRRIGQQFEPAKLYARIKEAFQGTYTLAGDLVNAPTRSAVPRSKPMNVKGLKLPKGVPNRLKRGLEAKAKQGFVVRGHVKELFRDKTLSKEALVEKLAEMLGIDGEDKLETFHWSRRVSKRAARDANLKTIEDFVTVMQQHPEFLDNPMYFTPTFYRNARTGYEETLINPQQNKLQRALLAPDKSNVEVSDDTITKAPIIWKKALYGGLAALGIKDSSSRHAVDRALKQVEGFYDHVWGNEAKGEDGVTSIQEIIEIASDDLSRISMDDFHHLDEFAKSRGFKGDSPLERVQGMVYVYQVSRFPKTNQAFKPEYQVEADGKTNGYYITLTQFPIKPMQGDNLSWFSRVGFFNSDSNPDTTSPFSDYMSQDGALDSYEAMGVDAAGKFDYYMDDRGERGDIQRRQLESILGKLINEAGGISSAIRNFMKDPFMKANYDAGAKSIVTALFDVIADSIGDKLEDFHRRFENADNKADADAVQKELNEFNTLFGTNLDRNNLLTSGKDFYKIHNTLTRMDDPNNFQDVYMGDGPGTVLAKEAYNSIEKPTGEIAKAKTAYSNGFNALWEAYTAVRGALIEKKLAEVKKEDGRSYLTQSEMDHITNIVESALPKIPHALNEKGEDYRIDLTEDASFAPDHNTKRTEIVHKAYGRPSEFNVTKPKAMQQKTPPTKTISHKGGVSQVRSKAITGQSATRWVTPPGANFLARFAQMIDGAIMILTLGKGNNYLDVHDGADTSPIQHFDVAKALNESAAEITANYNGAVEVERSLVRGFKMLLKISDSHDLGFNKENLLKPFYLAEMAPKFNSSTRSDDNGKPMRLPTTVSNIMTEVALASELVQEAKNKINDKIEKDGEITISQYNSLPTPEAELTTAAKMEGYDVGEGGVLPTGIADLVEGNSVAVNRAAFNRNVNTRKEQKRKERIAAERADNNSTESLGSSHNSGNRVQEAADGQNAVALSAAYLKDLVKRAIGLDSGHSKGYIASMQSLVSDVLGPLLDAVSDKSIKVIQDALKEANQADGTYSPSSKTIFLNMATETEATNGRSNLEVLLHETVHAVTTEALAKNDDFRREMHRLYSRAREALKPEMFIAKDPVTGKRSDDPDLKRQAEAFFDYIFNNPEMLNDKTGDGAAFQRGLAEFVAHAATNEALRNALERVPINASIDGSFDKTTLLGKIMNLFTLAASKLAQWFTDAPKGKNTLDQYDTLIRSLVAAQTKSSESKFNKAWNKVTGITGKYSDKFRRNVSDPAFKELTKAYDDIARGYEDKEYYYSRSLKNVSAMLSAAMAIKGYTESEINAKMKSISTHDQPLPRAMYELREVTGTSTESLMNTIKDTIFDKHGNAHIAVTKAVGSISAISAERENYEIAVRKKYEEFHKTVSKEENLALTNAMHTDLGLIFELFQDDPEALNSFMTSSDFRKSQMKQARKDAKIALQGHPQAAEIFNAIFAQGEGLAMRMVHGTTDYVVNQQPNAIRIVSGYMFSGTKYEQIFLDIPMDVKAVLLDSVDMWTTLKAYEMLPESSQNNMAALWKRESSMNPKENMVTELFLDQRGNQRMAEKYLFSGEGEFMDMTKGYVPTIYPADTDVQSVNASEVAEYTKRGYKVDRSFTTFNGKELFVVVKKVPQRPRHVEGAMPVLSEKASGVSASSLITKTEGKGTKISSTWVKDVSRDLTRIAISQQFSADPQNVNKNRPSESLPVPIQNAKGEVTDLRYLVTEKSKREIFKKDLDFLNIIARDSSKTLGAYAAKQHGMKTLDALIEDYNENKDATLLFTWVSPDPVNVDGTKNPYYQQYRMLPKEVRLKAHKEFGGRGIPIRKGMVHLILGYEEFSVNQTKFMQKLNKKYPKLEDGIRTIENFWIESVRYAKDRIAVASVKVFRMNLISNVMLQLANGMSLVDVVKYSVEAIRGLNEYTANMNKITELRNRVAVTKDPRERKRIDADIANIQGLMANSEIKEMVDNGLYQSISTEVKPKDTDLFPRMGKGIDKFGTKVLGDKAYRATAALPKNIMMTRDSILYKTMYTFTQSMDFVARYGLMKHLKKEDAKRADHEKLGEGKIYKIVLDSFINYAAPDHKGLKYANDAGFLWFTKYYLGIQRAVADLWKRKPVEAAALAMYQASVTDIYDIFDDSIVNRSPFSVVNNPISKTIETLATPALIGNMNYVFGFDDK